MITNFTQMFKYAIFFVFCFSLVTAKALPQKLVFFGGFGSYEALHIGLRYAYQANSMLGVSGGHFLGLIPDERYWNIGLEHDWLLRRKDIGKNSSWMVCPKVFYWNLEDRYYRFTVLSFEPSIGKRIRVSQHSWFKIDFGPVFMVVLDYKRLTFEEAGWPRKLAMNASLTYNVFL